MTFIGDFLGSEMEFSTELLLSFTLCNSDPRNGYWRWNFSRIESDWLTATLHQLTSFNISLESHVV